MSSPYLHQTIRRPIPPPFHHLLPSSTPDDTPDPSHNPQHHDLHLAEGSITSVQPADPSLRRPPLYTITYHSSTEPNGNVPYYTEQITQAELMVGLERASKRQAVVEADPTLVQPETAKSRLYRANMEKRRETGMAVEIEHGLLWRLVLAAAVELEWEERLRTELDSWEERTQVGRGTGGTAGEDSTAGMDGECPRYYRAHPTSYRGGAYRPPLPNGSNPKQTKKQKEKEEKERYEGKVLFAPSVLGQRVRLGIRRAYDRYCVLRRKKTDTKGRRGRRSGRRGMEEDGESPPRTTQSGGVVALCLLRSLGYDTIDDGEEKVEKEEKEEEKEGTTAGEAATVTAKDQTDASTNDSENQDDSDSDDSNYSETTNKPQSEPSPVGPACEYLLSITGQLPSAANTPDEEEDVEEGEEMINPFFKPSPGDVFEHLVSKQSGATSPAEIQTGICYAMEDSVGCQEMGLNLWNPMKSLLEDTEKEETSGETGVGGADAGRCLTLICTTGDSLKDLPEFEPTSFSRCRFRLSSFIPSPIPLNQTATAFESDTETEDEGSVRIGGEDGRTEEELEEERIRLEQEMREREEEERIRKEVERKEERAWKNLKQYEVWRYGGIVGGWTKWPDWKEFVREKLERAEEEGKIRLLADSNNGGDSGVDAAKSVINATVTSDNGVSSSIASVGNTTEATVTATKDECAPASTTAALGVDAELTTKPSPPPTTNEESTSKPISSTSTTDLTNTNGTTNGNKNQEADDATLAQSLTNTTTTTLSRRTRRATDSTQILSTSSNLIFYGSHQVLSAQQLLEAVHRLVAQSYPNPMTLMDLKRLVMDDGSSTRGSQTVNASWENQGDWKKVRSVMGKLVFRLGKLERVTVDCSESDGVCWERVLGDSNGLLTFGGDVEQVWEDDKTEPVENDEQSWVFVEKKEVEEDESKIKNVSKKEEKEAEPMDVDVVKSEEESNDVKMEEIKESGDTEMKGIKEVDDVMMKEEKEVDDVKMEDKKLDSVKTEEIVKMSEPINTKSSTSNQSKRSEIKERRMLQDYVRSLHTTELTLRSLLLRHCRTDDFHDPDDTPSNGGKKSATASLQQITPNAISTAADELEKDIDAADRGDFVDRSTTSSGNEDEGDDDEEEGEKSTRCSDVEVVWRKSPVHPLLGKVIYRPPTADGDAHRHRDQSDLACVWYRVVEYCPSVPLDDKTQEDGVVEGPTSTVGEGGTTSGDAIGENRMVRRRIRFRAVRTSASSQDVDYTVDGNGGKIESEEEEDDDRRRSLVLTEGQVRSGLRAGVMRRLLQGRGTSRSTTRSLMTRGREEDDGGEECGGIGHGLFVGARVSLCPLDSGDRDEEGTSKVLYAWVVGRDEVVLRGGDDGEEYMSEDGGNRLIIERRVLLLLDNMDRELDPEPEGRKRDTENSDERTSFWAKLSPTDQSILCTLPSLSSSSSSSQGESYRFELQQYHPSSPAYRACQTVLETVRSHVKSVPFLDPVDPIELGIPDYLEVVKTPMDISTVESKLSRGFYGRILPSSSDEEEEHEYTSPTGRMLNGPFLNDLELVFDNAMLFNPSHNWIHKDALALKRLVLRKIETLSDRAEREFELEGRDDTSQPRPTSRGRRGRPSAASSSRNQKSVYLDEGSDVSDYRYESDFDDASDDGDGGGGGRGRRKRKRGRAGRGHSGVVRGEDFGARAVEYPTVVPGSGGAIPLGCLGLPLVTNVREFALPVEWSCRPWRKKCNGSDIERVKEEDEEMADRKEEEQRRRAKLLRKKRELEAQNVEENATTLAPVRRSARTTTVTATTASLSVAIGSGAGAGSGVGDGSIQGDLGCAVEYYLPHLQDAASVVKRGDDDGDSTSLPAIPCTTARDRSQVETVREYLHEEYYARLYRRFCVDVEVDGDAGSYGTYHDSSFPPFLGRIVPSDWSPTANPATSSPNRVSWEIRTPYVLPALHWVLRGLIKSGHLESLDSSFVGGIAGADAGPPSAVVVTNHAYYCDLGRITGDATVPAVVPYDILDAREARRKRSNAAAREREEEEEEVEPVELSAYEKMRAERVARNKERLKLLGLG